MKHVFLLGAGFTRAVTEEVMGDKAPLNDEIVDKLDLSRFPEIQDLIVKSSPYFAKPLLDIEQIMTELDLRCLRAGKEDESLSKRLDEIKTDIIKQIVKIFDVGALTIDNLDKFSTLKKFIEVVPAHSTILTLNYDCVLDQGLCMNGGWTPCGGYGISSFRSCDDEEISNKKLDDILLLKLHGSCNFRKNMTDPYAFFPEISNAVFPDCNLNLDSNSRRPKDPGPHVLVMSYMKIYYKDFLWLWSQAVENLAKADKLTIIGCSLRDEDTFLKFALYHCGLKNKPHKASLDIVDKNYENCKLIEDRIKKLGVSFARIRSYGGLPAYLAKKDD